MRRIKLKLMAAVAASALALVVGGLAPAWADATLDTSKLARVPGAKETYASPLTTIFTSPASVEETAKAVVKLLAAGGWQLYTDPFASAADIPNLAMMTLKRGPDGLTVMVSLAPAQGNATSVSYTANPIAEDLPFAADASDIKYAPTRPYLSFVTKTPLADSLALFTKELAQRGWSGWSRKENRAANAGEDVSEPNERGRFQFFVREPAKPLMLLLQSRDDGQLIVTLEAVPQKLLTLAQESEEPKVETPSEPSAAARDAHDAFDDLAGKIMQDALKGLGTPGAPRAQAGPAQSVSELDAMEAPETPIPLPATATDIDFDAEDGDLSFESASNVASVAQFYRDAMSRAGWKSERSPINRDNMVVLRFAKDERDLSLTVMAFGAKTRVTADGSALVVAAAPADQADAPDAEADKVEFKAEEKYGLPVATPGSLSGSEKSLFRVSAHASVRAPVKAVVAFYRRELTARGWTEDGGAKESPEQVDISFKTPQGPGMLNVSRKGDETFAVVTLRQEDAARKAGMLPPAGQTKLLFGNILEKDAVITVGKTQVKVPAGSGAEGPDGPTLNIAPGKHKYRLRVPGKPDVTEDLDVASGDIWGVMIGPGGVLAVPMY